MSRFLAALVDASQRRAVLVVIVALLAGAGFAAYTAKHLSIDTNLQNLLAPELPWRQAEIEMDRQFPKLSHTLVVVIEGGIPEVMDAAQAQLIEKLRPRTDVFSEVFATETEAYFRRNGLMFFEADKLQKLADDITAAQPFLGALDQDPSLRGLFTLLGRALTAPVGTDFDLSPAFNGIATSVAGSTQGADAPLSWQALVGGGGSELAGSRRFIELGAKLDFKRLLPAELPVQAVRDAVRDLGLAEKGLKVRLTGTVAMEHEEIQTAFSGAGIALFLALTVSAVLLWFALRSLRLMLATILSLAYGLLLTTAFAAIAVGHLNLISVAFGVLYIGLGLDYALYLCMQYRERLGQGLAVKGALGVAASDVGGYMTVCAMTCSLGFFAFIPTDFLGIAELGVISGAGMIISLGVTVTLLPALIQLLAPDPKKLAWTPAIGSTLSKLLAWPFSHAKPIWIVSAVLVAGSLYLVPGARFDSDPLKLRDPKTEAIMTFRDLLKDPEIPTLTLSALVPDQDTATRLAEALGKLPEVKRAMTLNSFVPVDQEEKLAILEDLRFALGPQLTDAPAPTEPAVREDDYALIEQMRAGLPAYVAAQTGKQAEAAKALQDALDGFAAEYGKRDAAGQKALLAGLRANLLGSLPARLAGLKEALKASAVTAADLPPSLIDRWKSADGLYRVQAMPSAVLDNPKDEAAFIAAVQSVAPTATGGPSTQAEAGRSVVEAFQKAFAYSAIVITLLLLVLLRSVIDTLLVLIPLVMAGLLTVAASVLAGVPFNFANVIALPLILGVGVDYGVYLVQRGRAAADGSLLKTGTARAVLFGALITMVNFGNLAFAKHPGMVSMGLLLTLGLGMTLLCALVLLPSLLALRWKNAKA
ncbi:MMPL family transporter [uncultured Nevskia sp.]|uniref:MMPL family transporter n=1 Tax=uncultured Nevskia sp. TaxID=228950 RepID=UPI0025D5BC90|nr:MMPL family transporter [uncultured Nevskia sp.]